MMNISKVTRYAIPTVLGFIVAPAIASAQANICEGTTGPGTGLITLPSDLCCYQTGVPANLARRVIERDDFGEILLYMSEACPELALALNDFTTASPPGVAAAPAIDDGTTHCDVVDCTPTQPPKVEDPGPETGTETEDESPQID